MSDWGTLENLALQEQEVRTMDEPPEMVFNLYDMRGFRAFIQPLWGQYRLEPMEFDEPEEAPVAKPAEQARLPYNTMMTAFGY